jgi:cyclopropane fatty-acyl-phospholipid synthase-like methyltransferase
VSYAETWDRQAASLDDAKAAAWAEPDEAAATHAHLAQLGPMRSGVLLDLGCGWGRLAIPMARLAPAATVWALDTSPMMLRHLRAEAAGVPNLVPWWGDGETIPDDIGALSGAWSVLCFQHTPVEQQHSYLRQLADRLTPGGWLVVQGVTDTDPGPLSHPVNPAVVREWCTAAGLAGGLHRDPGKPTWWWLRAYKADR